MKRNDPGALARSGLRSTRQRVVVLDILEKSDAPLAVEQIYLELRNRGVAANLSTVYRILEALIEKNLAASLNIPGDPRAFFEYNHAAHRHYLVCLGCRSIRPLESCPLAEYEKRIERETEYSVSGHKLVVYGYCPECRPSGADPGGCGHCHSR